ncbi:DUF3035 domain-containing protein [Pelagibacterales bacterium SAG-MED24]|nr:DUF3035 domain-containing protein [Pelagibacterales bacterium SAG-MED24]
MKKVIKIFIISLILTSCQTAKDALSLKKKSGGDEFLVEKKSPLVLPPEFGKLPTPTNEQNNEGKSEENDIKSLVSNNDENLSTKTEKNTEPTSIEQSILKNIK